MVRGIPAFAEPSVVAFRPALKNSSERVASSFLLAHILVHPHYSTSTMPVATSSRRRSGRNAEPEDAIENTDPTQRTDRDDVEEEEQPRRNGRSVKQERQRAESSRNARQREEDPVEDEDAEGGGNPGEIAEFNPDDFGDQPLHPSQSHKLQGMAMDWDTMIKNVRGSAYSLLTDVATAIADIENDQGAEKVCSTIFMVAS